MNLSRRLGNACVFLSPELPPEFVHKIEPVKATVGEEKAVFEVELSKGDAKPKWYKNGAEIDAHDAVWRSNSAQMSGVISSGVGDKGVGEAGGVADR